ncbi:transposable element Tcb2 transposase [Trichonephila clavipes]|nr:transposable element Tcb2 transposase [Trichonephila clavipes]
MPLHRFRRQYEELSQLERRKIIGMMEAGWLARQVAYQLGHSGCVMMRCLDQWIREISFTLRPGSGRPRQISRREDHHIRRPLSVLPLTPTGRCLHLEWCRTNQVVFSDEFRFYLSSDDNRVHVWSPRGERFNPAFALQQHTAPTAGVMPEVVPFLQDIPAAIFQRNNARPHVVMTVPDFCSARHMQLLPWSAYSTDMSPIKHVWDLVGQHLVCDPRPTASNDELCCTYKQ